MHPFVNLSCCIALCLLLSVLSGCTTIGPKSISAGRASYADAINKTEDEQMLLAIPPLSQDLLKIAKEYGRLTVRNAVSLTGKNRNTIKAHIQKLVKNNLLKQEGRGKGTWYRLQ